MAGIIICASSDDGFLRLTSSGSALLNCANSNVILREDAIVLVTGALGSIGLAAGPPGLAPRMQLGPDSIKLEVGPPDVGASLEMTATEVTIKVGEVSLSLSATGIKESVLALVAREAGLMGHTMKAAETSLAVGINGITEKGPIKQREL